VLSPQTVHSFKGEDCDAVMIVVRRHYGTDPTSQLELWEAAVSGGDVAADKEEERRVMFVALTRAARYCLVALTRAARYCLVALPDDDRGQAVAVKCADLGFAIVEGS
jgi:superfamily I DNA/RNA helicase